MVHVQTLVLSLGLMGLNPHKFTHIVANHSREALIDRAYAYEILLEVDHQEATNDGVGVIIVIEQLLSGSYQAIGIVGLYLKRSLP